MKNEDMQEAKRRAQAIVDSNSAHQMLLINAAFLLEIIQQAEQISLPQDPQEGFALSRIELEYRTRIHYWGPLNEDQLNEIFAIAALKKSDVK